jgi:hypothetical protein
MMFIPVLYAEPDKYIPSQKFPVAVTQLRIIYVPLSIRIP